MDLQLVLIALVACQVINSTLSPFGVKMCQLLCQQFEDCTEFGFSQVHLVCSVESPVAGGDVLLYNGSRKHLPVCPSQSRLVHGRYGHSTCIKDIPRMRILVMRAIFQSPYTTKMETFFIDLHTGLKSSYNEIDSHYVCSIAYLSSIRKLVGVRKISHFLSEIELMSLTFKVSEELQQVNNLYTGDLKVDDDQRLVFYIVCEYYSVYFHSINALTKDDNRVMRQRCEIKQVSIAVDPTRRRLFVSACKRIFSVSYNGSNKKQINNNCCNAVGAMSLSYFENFLYVSNKYDLLKVSFEGKVESKLLRMEKKVKKIIPLDGMFIMLSKHESEIRRVILYQNTSKPFTQWKVGENNHDRDITLIKKLKPIHCMQAFGKRKGG